MDRQVSINVSEVNLEQVSPILEGKLENLPPISSRTVRVFISSTFSDMIQERNALMEDVYPKLKSFCREKYGLEFQLMDLRWGIREEASDDHSIIEFCLKEIDNCIKSSIGPSFVALLGQKYGYRPFPPNIKADEFHMIRQSLIRNDKDVTLLDTWFIEDTNTVPPTFRLQPISSVLKHHNDKSDPNLQAADKSAWNETYHDIQNLLRQGVNYCVFQKTIARKEREKYFTSVTEYEIAKGIFENPKSEGTCLCLSRHITNLMDNTNYPRARKFIDLEQESNDTDIDAQRYLKSLKETKLPKKTDFETITVAWKDPAKLDPTENMEYLHKFCKLFYDKMTRLIKNSVFDIANLVSDSFTVEVLQHLFMCQSRCKIFKGRSELIEQLKKYLFCNSDQPMVVYGESGCGKTSILAKAASLVHMWHPNAEPVLVLRFLGTSARSASVRLMLASTCWQIAIMYGKEIKEIPGDYPSLVTHFHELLKVATAEKPLVIFFDSLDQLRSAHNAHSLIWLPDSLPPHVKLVVSTLPQEYDLLRTLQGIVTDERNYLEVLPLGQSLSLNIINTWLKQSKRTLTKEQFKIVGNALNQCSLPLYAKLVFEEVCRWKSYDLPELTILESTVQSVINKLLDRVELHHGRTFVAHALSYLTASRNGLSEVELEDVMSIDDTVLNDVYIWWIPPIRRIPPLLWPRLYDDLASYMVQREANGTLVYFWYHRQFISAAKSRYLQDKTQAEFIHSTLADYYLGVWGGGRKKPYTYTEQQMVLLGVESQEGEADRKVPLQPLQFEKDLLRPNRIAYNLRKLSELPHHLLMSGRIEDLKKEVLFNYKWLHTKLCASSLHDVISDFRNAVNEGIDDPEVVLLTNTLRVGGSHVNNNPDTLAFDLSGRLLPFYNKYENIRSLLQQCDTESLNTSAMVPVFKCFESPSGYLHYILEDHSQNVLDVIFSHSTNELISLSRDNTIAFWDMSNGERTRTIDISMMKPGLKGSLLQSKDGKYLVCDVDVPHTCAHVYDLKTGKLLHQLPKKNANQKRILLTKNYLCYQKRIINLHTGDTIKSLDDYIVTKKSSITVAITENEEFILIGVDKEITMFHLTTALKITKFDGHNNVSRIVTTNDNKRAYVGYSNDCLLTALDIWPASPTFGKAVFGYDYKRAFPNEKFHEGYHYGQDVSGISVSKLNPYLVLANIKRCYLIVVDTEKNVSTLLDSDALDINEQTYIYSSTFSPDDNFVIAGQEHFLHIWNAKTAQHLSKITIHSVYRFPFAVDDQLNLIATGSNIHTAIKIWDLDRMHSSEADQLCIYENPINVVATAAKNRLLFVKKYYPLSSARGYKHIDNFGIDVWNLSTGHSKQFLPFDQYGKLLQMEVSPDGQYMALLMTNREESYFCMIDMKPEKGAILKCILYHSGAVRFTLSEDWSYVATEVDMDGDYVNQIKLWELPRGARTVLIENVSKSVFTSDGKYLLCIADEDSLVVFDLKDFTQLQPCDEVGPVDCIDIIPRQAEVVLLTTYANQHVPYPKVVLWDFLEGKSLGKLTGVARDGIKDISKDGCIGVDAQLKIFDLHTGKKLKELQLYDEGRLTEYNLVKITFDGKFVIYADDLSVKVCDIHNCSIVASVSTHEKSCCLTLLDYGYLVVVGREDGHLVTMKLINDTSTTENESEQFDEEITSGDKQKRNSVILKHNSCPEDVISTFDSKYQIKPEVIPDDSLPEACNNLKSLLRQKASIPHAVIKSESANSGYFVEDGRSSPGKNSSGRNSPCPSKSSGNNTPEVSRKAWSGPTTPEPIKKFRSNEGQRRSSSPLTSPERPIAFIEGGQGSPVIFNVGSGILGLNRKSAPEHCSPAKALQAAASALWNHSGEKKRNRKSSEHQYH